jgi:peroxiredoxin Q/BCP
MLGSRLVDKTYPREEHKMLKPGDKAPDFRLPSTSGKEASLTDYRGRKLVLYFYPKDQTPGCTREACDFRDNLARVRRTGAAVLGVSKDSLASHDRFREKYDLPFDLLTDSDNRVATAYGAFGEKTMYGKKVMGTIRSTYLIDEKGRIEALWSPVKVNGHVDQVLAALKGEAPPAKKTTVKKSGTILKATKRKTTKKK